MIPDNYVSLLLKHKGAFPIIVDDKGQSPCQGSIQVMIIGQV
jgi:hypothetical protein